MQIKNRRAELKAAIILLLFGFGVLYQVGFLLEPLKWDALDAFLPWRYSISELLRSGNAPWWSPYQHLGFPLHADPETGSWYPIVWVFSLFGSYDPMMMNIEFCLHLFIAGYGMFLLLSDLKCSFNIALVFSIAFMFNGFFIGNAQNFIFVIALAWFPLIIRELRLMLNESHYKHLFYFAFFYSMALTGGYPGMLIILSYCILFYLGYRFVVYKWIRKRLLIRTGLSAFLICLVCIGYVSSFLEFLPYINRSEGLNYDIAAQNPLTWKSLISFLVPSYLSAFKEVDWGTDVTMNNVYFGILSALLIAHWLVSKGKTKTEYILFFCALFLLICSFGNGLFLHPFLYEWLPGISFFRHPSIFRGFFIFCLIALASLFYARYVVYKKMNILIPLILSGVIIAILVYLIPYVHFNWLGYYFNNLAAEGTKPLMDKTSRLFLSLLFTLSIIIGYLLITLIKKQSKGAILMLLVIEVIIHSMVLMPYTVTNFKTGLPQMNATFHKSLNRELMYNNKSIAEINDGSSGIKVSCLWRNLNTYAKQPAYDGFNSFQFAAFNLLENSAFFNQCLKNKLIYASTQVKPMKYMKDSLSNKYNPTVLFSDTLESLDSGGYLNLKEVKFMDNAIHARLSLTQKNYITLMQNYHPNWKLYDNGKEIKLYNSNHCLMTAVLDKGDHHLVYAYKPKTFWSYYIVWPLWILLLISLIVLKFRKEKAQ